MEKSLNEVLQLSASVLAYIGDAIYEIYVREHLLEKLNSNVHKIHSEAIGYVSAHAQCFIIKKIEEELSEEEKNVVRRGRNAKVFSMPKNADPNEYRHGTSFEALIGFLHLLGRKERLEEIIKRSFDILEQEEKNEK